MPINMKGEEGLVVRPELRAGAVFVRFPFSFGRLTVTGLVDRPTGTASMEALTWDPLEGEQI